MMYFVMFVIALVICLLGFISEITRANITHLKYGRKPEAGASIFPTIILVPTGVLLLVWLLNKLHKSIGFYTVIALFIVYGVLWIFSQVKARGQLKELKKISRQENQL